MKKLLTLILFLTCFNLNAQINTGGIGIGGTGVFPALNQLAPEATSLLTDLKAWWKFDGVSGNAADSYGSNTLTAFNSPGSTTGKVNLCRSTVRATPSYLQATDTEALSLGDKDWTVVGWYQVTSDNTCAIFGKESTTGSGNREYECYYNGADDKVYFGMWNSGTTFQQMAWGSAISLSTWYFIAIWHDNTANKMYISINNGTPVEATLTIVPFDGANAFTVGAAFTSPTIARDGLTDEMAIWHRVLTTAERTYLYNAGAGRTYITGLIL